MDIPSVFLSVPSVSLSVPCVPLSVPVFHLAFPAFFPVGFGSGVALLAFPLFFPGSTWQWHSAIGAPSVSLSVSHIFFFWPGMAPSQGHDFCFADGRPLTR